MRNRRHTGRLLLHCGIPADAASACARVTLFGKSSAMIEGQCGVVEMSESRIRLKTKEGVLSVSGEGLILRELSLDAAMVHGQEIRYIGYADG